MNTEILSVEQAENEREQAELLRKQADRARAQAELRQYEYEREHLVDTMNERFAIFTDGLFLHEWLDSETGRKTYCLLTSERFNAVTADLGTVMKVGCNGKLYPTSAASYWISSPRRRKFSGIVFEPNGANPDKYNLWNGFAVEPDATASCAKYLEHLLNNICQGNTENYEYLLNWMADAVQNPGSKPGVSVVLRSTEKGTGKNTAANYFGSLFGEHYILVEDSKHLLGKFNAHLANKVVVFADESFWGGNKVDEGLLKGLITNEKRILELKGRNAIPVNDYTHLLMATNNNWAVPFGLDERRFFVLDVGKERAQDTLYFRNIYDEREYGGKEALLYLLLNRDLTGVDVRKCPETSGNERQRELSNPLIAFIKERVDNECWFDGEDGWTDEVSLPLLLTSYRIWLKESNQGKFTGTQADFIEALMKVLPKGFPKKKRGREKGVQSSNWVLRVPELDALEEHLNSSLRRQVQKEHALVQG